MVQPFIITADEVNCLIHAYFQDSGFVHSAFTLRHEGQLDKSQQFGKHVPRGELIELLSKALLYAEVEAHWRGNSMTTNCKSTFSLLERHTCSLDSSLPASVTFNPLPPIETTLSPHCNSTNGTAEKRKASTPTLDDPPREKRVRTEDMEVDSTTSLSENPATSGRLSAHDSPMPFSESTTSLSSKLSARNEDKDAVSMLKSHKTEVFVCAWNRDKKDVLASGSKDTVVHLWNVHANENGPLNADSPTAFSHLRKAEQGDLTSLDWNHDGSLLAIGSYDAILRVCNDKGELYMSEGLQKGPIFATKFSKSGQYLLSASLDGSVCAWDIPKKRLFGQYNCHEECCLDVDWLSDTMFATCGADAKIHLMSLDSKTPVKTLTGHMNEVNQIKCSPSQIRLASCSDDTTARIWHIGEHTNAEPSVDRVIVLSGHSQSISCIAWCPVTAQEEPELVVTSGFDGVTRLWDSSNGNCLQVFSDHKRPIYTLVFSPDAKYFTTGGGDGYLHLYDLKSRQKVWSWRSNAERPGIFEIDWQQLDGSNWLALALESGMVGLIDVTRIPTLSLE